ncbi:MAG: hypothetical protein A2520_01460 [Deltaproteobacteria bacterium RIFOXYD12_FULL_53_23]|nr:MAG: hypothetical protein A2520_01460 [Deltaproteobacteria bacterium RIFOXYD12_FULL_53_23]
MIEAILPTIGIAVATVLGTAIINTRIKFAKTEKDAMRDIKTAFLIILLLISQSFVVWLLSGQIKSTQPVTTYSVFAIVVYSLSLFSTYLLFLFLYITNKIIATPILDIIKKQMNLHGRTIGIIQNLPCSSNKDNNPAEQDDI